RPARHVLARQQHAARARSHDPEDRLQRGRLARRVAAQQADQLAGADLQRDALEDPHLRVVRRDVVEAEENVLHHASARASGSLPMYASTTPGWFATCSNVPSAILTPWSSAITRSAQPS